MKKLKKYTIIILVVGVFGYWAYIFISRAIENHLLEKETRVTKAVIINEKNYMGNQPVKAEFSYSYQFDINGKIYTGNAHDNSLSVGDSIEVKYNISYPSVHRPINPKD